MSRESIIFSKLKILKDIDEEFLDQIKIFHIFKNYLDEINAINITEEDKFLAFGSNHMGVLGFGKSSQFKYFEVNELLSDKQIVDFKN
jgi:hypothetical protein